MSHCRRMGLSLVAVAVAAFALVVPTASGQDWTIEDRQNTQQPGRRIDIAHSGNPVASLLYGEGQMKTLLNVYGEDGRLLTNPGLNAEGETVGLFPHHRGIFIGWNQIRSDLGVDDLWHMGEGGSIELAGYAATVEDEAARLATVMLWRSKEQDAGGGDLLITERRRQTVRRPGDGRTVVDFDTQLIAERDVQLDGDLQHAGIHFRAHHSVADRQGETAYLWEPADLDPGDGRIVSDDLRWALLIFPIEDQWYRVVQLNAPDNPVEELSWRDYGRFGFFFKHDLAAGEDLAVSYRFVIDPIDAPATPGDLSDEEAQTHRDAAEQAYQTYVD